MAAYGLYTHIASNKFRSMMLLGGLFLLIYVLVYAGALLAEVFLHGDRSVEFYLTAASHDLIAAFKATLKEAVDADLILHVIDASHPGREQQIAGPIAPNQTLEIVER